MKLIKRIGLIGLTASSFTLVVLLILAFLPRDNSSFSIQIDKISEDSHFTMSNSSNAGASKSSYYKATPLGDAFTTRAEVVENYLDNLSLLEGQQNLSDSEGKGLAMVYTVYLSNTSSEENQKLYYDVNLDGHTAPSNATNDPLTYLRIMIRTKVVESNELAKNVYYGNRIMRNPETDRTATTLIHSDREPISSRKSVEDPMTHNTVYTHDYVSNGNDGYCINFEEFDTGYLVKGIELIIPSGSTLCFTFVAYFEERDFDSDCEKPRDAGILLSVHFNTEV